MRRIHVTSVLCAFALVLGACGDEEVLSDNGSSSGSGSSASGADCEAISAKVKQDVEAEGTPKPVIPSSPAKELCISEVTTGDGEAITQEDADAGRTVTVNYVGVGQKSEKAFDSSFERGEPASFPLNGVIEGWTKGLVGMKVGGRRQITIPGALAYADSPPSADISAGETLVFVVDLKEMKDAPKPIANPEVSIPDAPATELATTDITVGTGAAITQADADSGTQVEVNYVGVGQQSKQVFDSSFERGESIDFGLNQVIPGWTRGLIGMQVGGRRQIVIPGELAYGENPPGQDIAPGETLVFVVDLLGIG